MPAIFRKLIELYGKIEEKEVEELLDELEPFVPLKNS